MLQLSFLSFRRSFRSFSVDVIFRVLVFFCVSGVCQKFTESKLIKFINVSALKSTNGEYIINGNYTVSPSGPYEVAGTTIDYHRFDENLKETHHHKRSDGVTEWVECSGPLFEPIHLMVNMPVMLS